MYPQGKFSTYRSFKTIFEPEKYLVNITIQKFRIAMARLRTGASYLHINRSFFNPNAIIKCPFCPKDETEWHFLLECEMYKDLRSRYVSKHFASKEGVHLGQLLANTSKAISHDVAMFIYYSLKLRSERLREAKLRKRLMQSINRM